MNDKARHEIAHLMSTMQCARDFACVKAGFEGLCEARDVGMEHNLICLDKQACQECGFGFTTGVAHVCRCPLRVHVAKTLKI